MAGRTGRGLVWSLPRDLPGLAEGLQLVCGTLVSLDSSGRRGTPCEWSVLAATRQP